MKKGYLTKSYPYSVSKVNILLSLITVLFWAVILYISSVFYLKEIESVHFWCILIIGTLGLVLGIHWFHKKSLSFIIEDLNVKEQKKSGFTESKLYFNGEEPHIIPTNEDNDNKEKTSQISFFFGLIKF